MIILIFHKTDWQSLIFRYAPNQQVFKGKFGIKCGQLFDFFNSLENLTTWVFSRCYSKDTKNRSKASSFSKFLGPKFGMHSKGTQFTNNARNGQFALLKYAQKRRNLMNARGKSHPSLQKCVINLNLKYYWFTLNNGEKILSWSYVSIYIYIDAMWTTGKRVF